MDQLRQEMQYLFQQMQTQLTLQIQQLQLEQQQRHASRKDDSSDQRQSPQPNEPTQHTIEWTDFTSDIPAAPILAITSPTKIFKLAKKLR
jgi:hypothetical protein